MADPHSLRIHFGFELHIPTVTTAIHIHGALPDFLSAEQPIFIRHSATDEKFITRYPSPTKCTAAASDAG